MLIRPTPTTVLAETRYVYVYDYNTVPHWYEVPSHIKQRGIIYVYLKLKDDNPFRDTKRSVYAEFSYHPDYNSIAFNQLSLVETALLRRRLSPFPNFHPEIEIGKRPSYEMLLEFSYLLKKKHRLTHYQPQSNA